MHTDTSNGTSFKFYDDKVDTNKIGFTEFARLYTTNELTLCQAVNGLRNFVFNDVYEKTGDPQAAERCTPTFRVAFEVLGHRLCRDDEITVKVGFDGSVDDWIRAGNKPKGWYQLFEDNYYDYLED
jgi:hypothetical protein